MKYRRITLLTLTAVFLCTALTSPFGQTLAPDMPTVTVTVDAKHPWVDSGVTVTKGDRVVFEATGTIQWGAKPDQVAGPEGHGAKPGKLGKGGLIGRVGLSGKAFPIGANRNPIVMPKDGKLFLGINDFVFGDNTGAFQVKVHGLAN
jgi:hypothetical protein